MSLDAIRALGVVVGLGASVTVTGVEVRRGGLGPAVGHAPAMPSRRRDFNLRRRESWAS